ncbi:MAG TPA: fumarylacetoacetate hydrolase family protein [Kiritimatiellia bacterium]|jgi:2-keto-4-pentenoate hydratase/2-oxohepta-3-ene-1,7-dioic acid hydratase in catechol pathway
MKLCRYGEPGRERPGVFVDGKILDVRASVFDIEDFNAHFFTHWGTDRIRALRTEERLHWIDAAGTRLGSPVARPGKIIAIGKNYADHAAEFDAELPTRPILFGKATTALAGPHDPIALTPNCKRVDIEAELAVVIGRTARRVSEKNALAHVAGYTVMNDVTERDVQHQAKQWFHGKGFDGFAPLGPFLVTADDVPDPQQLRVRSSINGQVLQDANTRDMIFGVARLIAFISEDITLEPGDIISTGTPGGVGFARNPPILLQPGDRVEIAVDGIGVQKNAVVGEEL